MYSPHAGKCSLCAEICKTLNCCFSYAGTWKLVNLFVRTKNFSYQIYYEKIGQKHSKILWSPEITRPWTDRNEQYASKEECIKWNKERTSIHSRFQGLQENQKESISKFTRPSKLAGKVNSYNLKVKSKLRQSVVTLWVSV